MDPAYPALPLFRNMTTVVAWDWTSTSGRPSPLKSPTASACGVVRPKKVGKWVLLASYKAGGQTFRSKTVTGDSEEGEGRASGQVGSKTASSFAVLRFTHMCSGNPAATVNVDQGAEHVDTRPGGRRRGAQRASTAPNLETLTFDGVRPPSRSHPAQ